jgi:DNA-binding beta-propeller fold protein YncE
MGAQMAHPHMRRAVLAAVVLLSAPVLAQENPYRTVENWAQLPAGRTWGSTSAVDIDRDGKSVWVAERCGANSCVGSNLPTVLKFDASGKLVTSFGAGMFIFPHGIHVDRDGNVWIVDGMPPGRGTPPPAGLGHTVVKFSPEGKVLMTLGTPGGATEPGYFFQPNDILVAPDGAIFVAEGHGGPNSRVLKFTKDGKLIKTWGRKGTAPGEFDQPHALAMDSKGRLFVGDRGNNRIQIFDQDGNLLEQWTEFSRPSGIFIDKDDTIYVTDSESGSVAKDRTDWKRGIRIGKISDRKVIAFIPDPVENITGTSAAEGIAVDAAGNIYGAEVGSKSLKKYVKR